MIGFVCLCVSFRICDPEPIRKERKLQRVSSTVVDIKNEVVFSSVEHDDNENLNQEANGLSIT